MLKSSSSSSSWITILWIAAAAAAVVLLLVTPVDAQQQLQPRVLQQRPTQNIDGFDVPVITDGSLPAKNKTLLYGNLGEVGSNRVLIKVVDGDAAWDEFIDRAERQYATDQRVLTGIRSKSVCAIRVDDQKAAELSSDPLVEAIEPDRILTTVDMNDYRIIQPDQLSSLDPKLASPSTISSARAMVDKQQDAQLNEPQDYVRRTTTSGGKDQDNLSEAGAERRDDRNHPHQQQHQQYPQRRTLQQREPPGFFNRENVGQGNEQIPYGIPLIQADLLWNISQVDQTIQLCVVDTGYNLGHDDLPIGPSFVDGTSTEAGVWPVDGNGHGTHVSGTVAAVGGNNIGVVGVRKNPLVQVIHAGKGLDDEGAGFASTVLAAVQGCVDSGARVISMSLGGPTQTAVERRFYESVYDDNVLIVAAAGNSGDTGDQFPASYPTVMSVAAVDANLQRPGFSQCNSQVEIAAPGVDILSTYPTNVFALSSGTSMACPHVAAVAAELIAVFPQCTASQIRNVMLRSAKPIGEAQGCNNGYGAGLVQAMAAHDLLAAEGCDAGGPALARPSTAAVGGCEQNPDFVAAENPNRGQCPGGVGNAFLWSWTLVVTTMIGLASVLMWDT